jgi:phage gp16-like protein
MDRGQAKNTAGRRKKLIQMIHVGKANLGMDDGAYRAFLGGACGKESAARMTIRELESALGAMRKQGFGPGPRRVKPEEQGGANAAQLEYIKGMWQKCARNKSGEALAAFAYRIAGVKPLRFLTVQTAQKVILALRDMMVKAGFDPDTSEALDAQGS